jgi:hypothetical protein
LYRKRERERERHRERERERERLSHLSFPFYKISLSLSPLKSLSFPLRNTYSKPLGERSQDNIESNQYETA